MPEPINLLDRYPWTCPGCAYEADAGPSLSMRCGDNNGCVRCPKCQAFLHLMITPDLRGLAMCAELYEAYCNRIQAVTGAAAAGEGGF